MALIATAYFMVDSLKTQLTELKKTDNSVPIISSFKDLTAKEISDLENFLCKNS